MLCRLPQGREDGLEMVHWVKGYKDANGRIRDAQEGDYPFAKYNKKVRVVQLHSYMHPYVLQCCAQASCVGRLGIFHCQEYGWTWCSIHLPHLVHSYF